MQPTQRTALHSHGVCRRNVWVSGRAQRERYADRSSMANPREQASLQGEVVLINVQFRAGLPEDGQPRLVKPELKVGFLFGCEEPPDDPKERGRLSLAQLRDPAADRCHDFTQRLQVLPQRDVWIQATPKLPGVRYWPGRIEVLAGLSHDGGWRHADAGLQLIRTQHITHDIEGDLSLDSHALPNALAVVTLLLAV
jgi:hypothetical protein